MDNDDTTYWSQTVCQYDLSHNLRASLALTPRSLCELFYCKEYYSVLQYTNNSMHMQYDTGYGSKQRANKSSSLG